MQRASRGHLIFLELMKGIYLDSLGRTAKVNGCYYLTEEIPKIDAFTGYVSAVLGIMTPKEYYEHLLETMPNLSIRKNELGAESVVLEANPKMLLTLEKVLYKRVAEEFRQGWEVGRFVLEKQKLPLIRQSKSPLLQLRTISPFRKKEKSITEKILAKHL